MIRYKIGFEKTKAAGVLIEERGEHMPTTYTHYRFGKDVLDALPRRIRTAMETNRELFDIGLHGPDILFYYRALIPNSVSGQGYGMHKQMADLFSVRRNAPPMQRCWMSPAEIRRIIGCTLPRIPKLWYGSWKAWKRSFGRSRRIRF